MTLRDKRVAIFGCGYLGAALAEEILVRGGSVIALTRNEATAEKLRGRGVGEVVVAELSDAGWHERVLSVDLAVNCVGSGRGGIEGYRRSYAAGMESVGRWASQRAGPLETFVYTGSVSVYAGVDGEKVDEDAPVDGSAPLQEVLLQAEGMARGMAGAGAERSFVLRLAGLYGPGRHVLADRIRLEGVSAVEGDGRFLNLVHRDDAVAAVLACLLAPQGVSGGTYNVVDDEPAPRDVVGRWLAARIGTVDGREGGGGDGSSLRRNRTLANRKVSNARIRAELGWAPRYRDFRAGYAAVLD